MRRSRFLLPDPEQPLLGLGIEGIELDRERVPRFRLGKSADRGAGRAEVAEQFGIRAIGLDSGPLNQRPETFVSQRQIQIRLCFRVADATERLSEAEDGVAVVWIDGDGVAKCDDRRLVVTSGQSQPAAQEREIEMVARGFGEKRLG